MPTSQEICRAKHRVVGEFKPHRAEDCGFGRVNELNPNAKFTGCPACKAQCYAGVTIEETEADMRKFMARITRKKEVES